jgi:hypothetical protein
MHKTANLGDWYQEHGRHAVYAAGKSVPGIEKKHSLSLPIVQAVLAKDNEAVAAESPYLIRSEEEQILAL